MKVTVCASLIYHYEVDLPDELCKLDADGDIINETEFYDACVNGDPITFNNILNAEGDILNVYETESGKDLYIN